MELWIKSAQGKLLAVYVNGRMMIHAPFDKNALGAALFGLLAEVMREGAVFGEPLKPADFPEELDLGGV